MNQLRLVAAVAFVSALIAASTASATSVVVIAPSVSTSQEARRVLAESGLTETFSYRRADAILVVVRSGLLNPLQFSYECIYQLKTEAEMQSNIVGEKFHVYLYSIDDQLKANQVKHVSYKAQD